MDRDYTDIDLYTLLDAVCHTAMENCPAPEIVEVAKVLHKQILEDKNFDLVKNFKQVDESLTLKEETKYTLNLRSGLILELDPQQTESFSDSKMGAEEITKIILQTYNALSPADPAVSVKIYNPATRLINENLSKISALLYECEEIAEQNGVNFKFLPPTGPDMSFTPMPKWFSSSDKCNYYEDYGWKEDK